MRTESTILKNLRNDIDLGLFRLSREMNVIPQFRRFESAQGARTVMEGRERLMFGSNNYLGLATDERVIEAAVDATRSYGAASTGSRLLNGSGIMHVALEEQIAAWHGSEDAIICTSGHQAGSAAIGAVCGAGHTVLLDRYVHASLHDGARLSRAESVVFEHNDLVDLESRLAAVDHGSAMVVVDSVYSMTGEVAPLVQLRELCDRYEALLLVDEAHGAGVFGDNRVGLCRKLGVRADITMGCLSKAIASTGGYLACSTELADAIRIYGRALIFTTSGTPSSIAAAEACVQIIRSDEGAELAARLAARATYLRSALTAAGCPSMGQELGAADYQPTPIVSLPLGGGIRAYALWNHLYHNGIYGTVAIYPAVPRNESLIRLCVNVLHTEADLDELAGQVADGLRFIDDNADELQKAFGTHFTR